MAFAQLENGQFLSVAPGLVRRLKQHFVTLPCGVDAVLGLNGYIWLTESVVAGQGASAGDGAAGAGAGSADMLSKLSVGLDGAMLDPDDAAAAEEGLAEAIERMKRYAADRTIGPEGRARIARVANAIALLSRHSVPIWPRSIMEVYSASAELLAPKDILDPSHAAVLLAAAGAVPRGPAGGGGDEDGR
jgi:hypothetical protein